MSRRAAEQYATALATLAMLTWAVRPRQQKALTSLHEGLSGMIRAATAAVPTAETRTAAEKYAEQARAAVADFWRGFTDDWSAE